MRSGHVNEFVTKYWNQWMLLLLAWAVLDEVAVQEFRDEIVTERESWILVTPMPTLA